MTLQETPGRTPADVAYRRAWWSLALFPLSFVGAFLVGEGLYTLLTDDAADAPVWAALAAGVPALVVFSVPAVLAVVLGRRAMRLGRDAGKVPAIVGLAVAVAFVAQNLLAFVVGLLLS
jgi:hypothetical protein